VGPSALSNITENPPSQHTSNYTFYNEDSGQVQGEVENKDKKKKIYSSSAAAPQICLIPPKSQPINTPKVPQSLENFQSTTPKKKPIHQSYNSSQQASQSPSATVEAQDSKRGSQTKKWKAMTLQSRLQSIPQRGEEFPRTNFQPSGQRNKRKHYSTKQCRGNPPKGCSEEEWAKKFRSAESVLSKQLLDKEAFETLRDEGWVRDRALYLWNEERKKNAKNRKENGEDEAESSGEEREDNDAEMKGGKDEDEDEDQTRFQLLQSLPRNPWDEPTGPRRLRGG
jgi:hypothetical protein